jgi:hypothetical protein
MEGDRPMNRSQKEATVRRYHYDSHDQLREHLATFLAAYNCAKRLKTSAALRPTNISVNVGQKIRISSSLIRSTTCRD